MKVDSIVIKLSGKHRLAKLADLGFQHIEDKWLFVGRMHRYTFEVSTDGIIRVMITANPHWISHGLVPRITFRQVNDWIGKCVDTIEVKEGSR
jgi:hypothetical protein